MQNQFKLLKLPINVRDLQTTLLSGIPQLNLQDKGFSSDEVRKWLDSQNLSTQAKSSISRLLSGIVMGKDEVLTSPLLVDRDASTVLSSWDSIYNNSIYKLNQPLRHLEENNRSKFGPRSIAIPWLERRESLLQYFGCGKKLGNLRLPSLKGTNSLRPITAENALKYMKNSSNSGLPMMVRKGNVKTTLVSSYREVYDRVYPAVLFTRTQESSKTRNVWGISVYIILLEMMFYRPLLDYQRKLSWRAAVNNPIDVDRGLTKLIGRARALGYDIVSIDFSAYDSSVKQDLQKAAFNYIKQLYQVVYHKEIDFIENLFRNIPIITPEGVLTGPHGVPSGSTFTNEVDSIVQYLVALNCKSVDLTEFQVQGDDGVYISDNYGEVVKNFTDFGLKVNTDKTVIAKDYAVYLQMLYHPDYSKDGLIRGVYPTYRALCRILFLERFVDMEEDISGKDYFAIRTISILENCKHHPLFEELVKFVWSLDKYQLKFSDAGLRAFIERRRKQEGKDINFRNWHYGSDVSGIRNFETYKIISRLNL